MLGIKKTTAGDADGSSHSQEISEVFSSPPHKIKAAIHIWINKHIIWVRSGGMLVNLCF